MCEKIQNKDDQYTGDIFVRAHHVTKKTDESFPLGCSNQPELFDVKLYEEPQEYNIVVFEKLKSFKWIDNFSYKPVKIVYIGFDVISIDDVPDFLKDSGCKNNFINSRIKKMRAVGAEFCVKLPRYPYTERLTEVCEVIDNDHNVMWPKTVALAS